MTGLKFKNFFLIGILVFMVSSCTNLDIQTLTLRAKQLMDSGDIEGAIGRLESINDLNPTFPQTHYNLGIAYYKKGDFEKAIKSLNRAIELDKTLADAHYSLGVIYEDIATTEIQKNTKNTDGQESTQNQNIENPETLQKIVENLKNSQESYKNYLKITKNLSEVEEIRTKVESLNTEIDKYQTLLIKKPNTGENY